jgi:P4 family phage/plasmid primase-like protien
MLYNGRFAETLDQDLDMIGLGGGQVYDLNKGLARKALPSDRVSLSTGVVLPDIPDDKHKAAVLQFVSDIFDGDRDSIDYVLKMLAAMCGGHTSDELFHVFIGTGANGKSKLQELMRLSLGSYYATVPCTLFTGRRGAAQGATAAFEHLANKRAVFVQEPERGQRMNGGLLKELSGGDTIYSRALFKEGREFKPQAKFILVSNVLPDVAADDKALWRRLRAIPFEITFKAHPKGNKEKKRDDNLSKKLIAWAPAFLHLLLTEYYPRYKKEGIATEPPAVLRATGSYRRESCPLIAFCDDNIGAVDPQNTKQDVVMFKYLVEKVRQHYQGMSKRCPSQKKLEGWFEKRWGAMEDLDVGRGWESRVWY